MPNLGIDNSRLQAEGETAFRIIPPPSIRRLIHFRIRTGTAVNAPLQETRNNNDHLNNGRHIIGLNHGGRTYSLLETTPNSGNLPIVRLPVSPGVLQSPTPPMKTQSVNPKWARPKRRNRVNPGVGRNWHFRPGQSCDGVAVSSGFFEMLRNRE